MAHLVVLFHVLPLFYTVLTAHSDKSTKLLLYSWVAPIQALVLTPQLIAYAQ